MGVKTCKFFNYTLKYFAFKAFSALRYSNIRSKYFCISSSFLDASDTSISGSAVSSVESSNRLYLHPFFSLCSRQFHFHTTQASDATFARYKDIHVAILVEIDQDRQCLTHMSKHLLLAYIFGLSCINTAIFALNQHPLPQRIILLKMIDNFLHMHLGNSDCYMAIRPEIYFDVEPSFTLILQYSG